MEAGADAPRSSLIDGTSVAASSESSVQPAPPQLDAAAAGFSADELAVAVRVLQALSRPGAEEIYASRPLQPLRRSLEPLLARQQARKFGGTSKEEHDLARREAKKLALLAQKERQLERNFIDKTQLRASRLAKLAALTEQQVVGPSGAGGLLLVPDGVADDGFTLLASGAIVAPAAIADSPASATANGELGLPAAAADAAAAGASALPVSFAVEDRDASAAAPASAPGIGAGVTLVHTFRSCYSCKRRYRELHHFYSSFCPDCAAFNWAKRVQTADLTGRVVLVTGARVKIGFHIVLKLLRAGAHVIATTRFPRDAAERYAALPDFAAFSGRLRLHGVDLRDLPALEDFCALLLRECPRLDAIINNACQTVRRPPAYYAPLLPRELQPLSAAPAALRPLLEHAHAHQHSRQWPQQLVATVQGRQGVLLAPADHAGGVASGVGSGASVVSGASEGCATAALANVVAHGVASSALAHEVAMASPSAAQLCATSVAGVSDSAAPTAAGPMPASSASMSQLALLPGDDLTDTTLFPTGLLCARA